MPEIACSLSVLVLFDTDSICDSYSDLRDGAWRVDLIQGKMDILIFRQEPYLKSSVTIIGQDVYLIT